MKKFLLGLVSGFVLAGLACLILFLVLVRLGDRRPSIPSDGVLVVRLQGELPEQAPVEIPLPVFQSQSPITMYELWSVLRRAEKDNRVKAVVLEPWGLGVGWARLQEIRAGLVNFRRSGKPLYAFLRNPGMREYYLATVAEKIYLTQEDLLDIKGLRAELSFYRKTLDKVGVEFEVEHAGKYKDAADSFVRTQASAETREVMNSVLDAMYAHWVDTIASSRKMPADRVRALIDDGPFLAKQAREKGLVDGLLFEDQVYDAMKERLKVSKLAKIGIRDYRSAGGASGDGAAKRIALVIGEGDILRGGDADPFAEEAGIRSGAFTQMLRQVGEDTAIRAVILRINSPGGDAIASDEILHGVRKLSKAKPLVVSMSDLAASGGYYISMSGDPVIGYANTFTGSIGVIYGKLNAKQLYEKLGITTEVMQRGRHAGFDLMSQPMSAEARQRLREGVDSTYRAFLARVSEGRRRKIEEVEPLAQGRVWLGSQAKANGLIDELGGLDRALDLVKQKAKIAPDERVQIVVFPRRKTLFEQLFSSSPEAAVQAAARERLRSWLGEAGISLPNLELWSRGGIFRLAPYQLRVH